MYNKLKESYPNCEVQSSGIVYTVLYPKGNKENIELFKKIIEDFKGRNIGNKQGPNTIFYAKGEYLSESMYFIISNTEVGKAEVAYTSFKLYSMIAISIYPKALNNYNFGR